jgi:hypothetical protein
MDNQVNLIKFTDWVDLSLPKNFHPEVGLAPTHQRLGLALNCFDNIS